MGGKPSRGTTADMRMKANQPKTPAKKAAPVAPKAAAKPKFGSAAWDARYGTKPKGK